MLTPLAEASGSPIETAAQSGTAAARRGLILTCGRDYPTAANTPTSLDKDLLMLRIEFVSNRQKMPAKTGG
jgi:hypothetical protein